MKSRYLPRLLVLLLGIAQGSAILAQAPAMTGPFRVIVGFPAGGAEDVLARVLADKLEDELKAPVIVENRSGAGGQLAAVYVRGALPDGLTVLLANTHMMVMAPLTRRRNRFDPLQDFHAVGRAASYHEAIAMPADLPAASVSEWLDGARGDDRKASYGVPAPGSVSQFIGYRLGRDHRTDLRAVPYRGGAPLARDLAGGHIPAGIVPASDLLPYYRAGKLKILAVNGARRAILLPGVPTLKELGLPHFDSLEWNGLFVPQGTPHGVIAQWNSALAKVLASGDIKGQLLKIGMEADPSTPDALQAQLVDDRARWGPVIEASGFTMD